MAFIVKKVISGNEYYYLRESVRKDGKVKAVSVAYLGKDKDKAEKKAKEIMTERIKEKKDIKTEIVRNGNMADNKNKIDEKAFGSFVQESGFIWGPEPEIYGGLAGFYTYGPLGTLLKKRVERSVRNLFNQEFFREIETPTVFPDEVWKASGHLDTFNDPVIYTKDRLESYRADKVIEDAGVSISDFSDKNLIKLIKDNSLKAPSGKEFELKIERQSLMMKTSVAGRDASLRPETATGTYLPFLRMHNFFRKKLPFGVYQIGKAYRNEISPRQSVLRGREFTQAEAQLFIDPNEKNNWDRFEEIKDEVISILGMEEQEGSKDVSDIKMEELVSKGLVKSKAYAWCLFVAYKQFVSFGIPKERIRLRQHLEDEKAFYADDAWDIEVNFNNFGWTEVCGVHDRTDYDLRQHSSASGQKLEAVRENGERFIPHILEIAFGIDRPVFALLDIFYDKKSEGEGKTMFKVPYFMAPFDVSVFPLMKKPELLDKSREVLELLKDFVVDYDVSGSIGKRYLRSAVAGTPFAVTIDYDSLDDESVTIRDRDTEKQKRVKIDKLAGTLRDLLSGYAGF